ncbi:hypothetical protein [Chitinolyticbacter albus]|uniref:hypothetical protein n=1 Tax=Chitinolyticbacter albus TaxID=2961951 RepID=UPI00210C5DFA|nr:hypothetical protein [Chitinolyticbacter albus]
MTPPSDSTPPPPDPIPDNASVPADAGLRKSPIHLLSALVMLATDHAWQELLPQLLQPLPRAAHIGVILGASALVFAITALSVLLVQRCIERDAYGIALAKAVAMGVLAGLPYAVGTTEIGLAFVAWAGITELLQRGNKP